MEAWTNIKDNDKLVQPSISLDKKGQADEADGGDLISGAAEVSQHWHIKTWRRRPQIDGVLMPMWVSLCHIQPACRDWESRSQPYSRETLPEIPSDVIIIAVYRCFQTGGCVTGGSDWSVINVWFVPTFRSSTGSFGKPLTRSCEFLQRLAKTDLPTARKNLPVFERRRVLSGVSRTLVDRYTHLTLSL